MHCDLHTRQSLGVISYTILIRCIFFLRTFILISFCGAKIHFFVELWHNYRLYLLFVGLCGVVIFSSVSWFRVDFW